MRKERSYNEKRLKRKKRKMRREGGEMTHERFTIIRDRKKT